MAQRSPKPATRADIDALPSHVVGQVVDGALYTHARPATPHARAMSSLSGALDGPFDKGRGGPGGWIILFEPELHFGPNILVPGIAGWRRTRMPELPEAPYLTLSPDCVCEGLSASTAAFDRGPKLRTYAREGVAHVWFIDPEARTLEVLRLDGATYRIVASFATNDRARAEPFESFELELPLLWMR